MFVLISQSVYHIFSAAMSRSHLGWNIALLPDGVLFSIDFFVCMHVCMYHRLLIFLCIFFLSLFVYLLARLRENSWTDLHKIFREGVEWPWDDLITFWSIQRNRAMPRCATRGRGLCAFAPQLVYSLTQSFSRVRLQLIILSDEWTPICNSLLLFYYTAVAVAMR